MTMSAEPTHIYRALRRIRRVEERIVEIYPSDKIKSPVHLSIGQEAVSVGVCDVLNNDDVITITYRGHAAYLAKGGDLEAMMAELFGKATGCGGGKAGSMHLVDMAHGIIGASAVVGTTIPLAVGQALAFKREGRGRVAVTFLGDGATEEGVFAESVNFAALHKLPVLFVIENNGYAIHAPLEKRWATDRIGERVETYGVPVRRIDSGDVMEIRDAAEEAVTAMRKGAGPYFMECATCRWLEHVGPKEDFAAGYRYLAEQARWRDSDPVEVVGALLVPAIRTKIDAEIEDEIGRAVDYAEQSPFPESDELWTNVYAD